MTDLNEPSAKVLFRVTNEDGSTEVETLWAFALGDSRYKIDNLPFFAYGVSLHDIVHAPLNTVEGFATFERVVSKSGNRTIRVIFEPALADDNDSHKILSGLVALGVEYEGANRSYVVLNLPPAVDLGVVVQALTSARLQWEHADPTYEQLHPTTA